LSFVVDVFVAVEDRLHSLTKLIFVEKVRDLPMEMKKLPDAIKNVTK
jgi:hypothetical protein